MPANRPIVTAEPRSALAAATTHAPPAGRGTVLAGGFGFAGKLSRLATAAIGQPEPARGGRVMRWSAALAALALALGACTPGGSGRALHGLGYAVASGPRPTMTTPH